MKGSKWTWLRDKCIELGYNESAKLAQEIEEVLHRLYGVTDTKAWRNVEAKDVEEAFKNSSFNVISNVDYCCACEETKRFCLYCDECKFGMEVGICDISDSLYVNFCDIFEGEKSKNERW